MVRAGQDLRNKLLHRSTRRRPVDYPLRHQTYAGLEVVDNGQRFVIIQGNRSIRDSLDPSLRDTTQGFNVAPVLPDGSLGKSHVRVILYYQIQAGTPWKGRW